MDLLRGTLVVVLLGASAGCGGGQSSAPRLATPSAPNTPSNAATQPPIGHLTASPTSINFGSIIVGNQTSQQVTLQNTGAASLTINTISTTGNTNFAFSGIANGQGLTVGQTIQFTVTFQPQAAGTPSETITLASTADNPSVQIQLSGTGVAQTRLIGASPTSINFGNVTQNTTSSQSVLLTNTGNSTFTLGAATVPAGFSVTGYTAGVTTVAPGGNVTITIQFTAPPQPGTYRTAWKAHDQLDQPFGVQIYMEIIVE